MRKNVRKAKPNANPMRVVAKVNYFWVTLPYPWNSVRVRAGSKGAAYEAALIVHRNEGTLPANVRPLSLSIEIDRPKVSF